MNLHILFLIVLFLARAANANMEKAYHEQSLVLISDYDETLTGQGWNTLWFLKKIPKPQSFLQLSAVSTLNPNVTFDSLPAIVPVTSREVGEFLFEKLAIVESNGQITPRSLSQHLLPMIPGIPERALEQSFVPGFYRVTDESFERFRTSQNHFHLLEDNQRAQLLERTTGLSRFGISFPIFRLLTNSRRTIDNIHIVTARAQAMPEFESLFLSWQKEGFIKNIKGQRLTLDRRNWTEGAINTYPVGSGLGLLHGDAITERKIQLVRDQIINQYLLLAKQQQKKYVVVIAENDPATVHGYVEMLKELMGIPEYQKYFEFIFLNAGTEFEVSRSGLPGRWTRVTTGSLKPLEDVDIEFLSGKKGPAKQGSFVFSGLACKSLF